MPALLESVNRDVAERLIARVKRRAVVFLQKMGIFGTTPQFEQILDRTISQGCRRGIATIREGGRPIRAQDADSIYRSQFAVPLADVCSVFKESFSGVALNVSGLDDAKIDLSVKVLVRDESGIERSVPAFLFVCHRFEDGDRFEKPPADLTARPDWLSSGSVDNDWRFLWSRLGDREFCGRYWNEYVAVFMQEVVGHGSTDAAARDAAVETLSQRGTTHVPSERFAVDFVGDA